MPQPNQNSGLSRHFGPSIRLRHLRTSCEHMGCRDKSRREHCPGVRLETKCGDFLFFLCSCPGAHGGERPFRCGPRDGPRAAAGRSAGGFGKTGRQTVCKPGSVPARTRGMAIHLGRPSPDASRDQPGRPARKPACPRPGPETRRPYSVLLPVGFAMPATLPPPRCALTAPFHPCPPAGPEESGGPGGRSALCGTFPGVAPAGRYPAPCFRGARTFLPPAAAGRRPSDRLAHKRRKVRARARQAVAARSRSRARRSASRAVSGSATPSTRRGRKWR